MIALSPSQPSRKYFATFISGCQQIIQERLNKFPNNALSVLELQDGVVVFKSVLGAGQLSELRFFNNVYQLLSDDAPVGELPIPDILEPGTFTIRARRGSQPTSPPADLAHIIAARTGLLHTAHKPDHQFLLWQRNDGRILWGLALPQAGFRRRRIEAGELRPELAHILGLVAGLNAKHNVLDPFAGYGGIARECLQGFHAKEAIAVESNEHLIPHLKSIPHLVALHGDARQLAHIHTHGIDRIITDPPWGNFEQHSQVELGHLYRSALLQMHRVLRAKGVAVVLTAAPFLPNTAQECGFAVERQYHILVAGRKAIIYKLRRSPR